jgi:hypothetical protein
MEVSAPGSQNRGVTFSIPGRLAAACRSVPDRAAWLARLPETLCDLERRWSLTIGVPFDGDDTTCAWVAPVTLATGPTAVLKLGMPHMEVGGRRPGATSRGPCRSISRGCRSDRRSRLRSRAWQHNRCRQCRRSILAGSRRRRPEDRVHRPAVGRSRAAPRSGPTMPTGGRRRPRTRLQSSTRRAGPAVRRPVAVIDRIPSGGPTR